MTVQRTVPAVLLVLGLAVGAGLEAKVNDPNVALNFVPQQAVGAVVVDFDRDAVSAPVAIRVTDGRGKKDLRVIGRRSDDNDRLVDLRATSDVAPFVEDALTRTARKWGVNVSSQAAMTLEAELVTYRIIETNQPVGAMFESDIEIQFRLRDASGKETWSGRTRGQATRYGKKFSNANCNEVLSDALLEALGAFLDRRDVQQAWSGKSAATEKLAAGKSPTPAALLEELVALMRQGFESDTMKSFVSQQRLSSKLTAQDLIDWRSAGVPEPVIQTALACPVD